MPPKVHPICDGNRNSGRWAAALALSDPADAHNRAGLLLPEPPQREPAQVTSASAPTVSGHDEAAVLMARFERRVFPGRTDQIAQARDFTRRVLAPCPVLDEAILLASELAANAVAHTVTGSGGHFDVTIYRDETLVVIAVRDEGSDDAPAARPLDEIAEDGRGLGLVELIADRWGHCGNEHGRTIWLQLRWKNL